MLIITNNKTTKINYTKTMTIYNKSNKIFMMIMIEMTMIIMTIIEIKLHIFIKIFIHLTILAFFKSIEASYALVFLISLLNYNIFENQYLKIHRVIA
jgi:hypothetical protein